MLDPHQPGSVTVGDWITRWKSPLAIIDLQRGYRRLGDRSGEPADRHDLPAAVVDERRGDGGGLRRHQIRLVPGGALERREQRLGLPRDPPRVRAIADARAPSNGVSNGPNRLATTETDADCGNGDHRDRGQRDRARAGQHPRRYSSAATAATPSTPTTSGSPATTPTPWEGSSQIA